MSGSKDDRFKTGFLGPFLRWRNHSSEITGRNGVTVNDFFAAGKKHYVDVDVDPIEEIEGNPGAAVTDAEPEKTPHYRCSIVVCARWETDHITEWLIYHSSIGFDHVYLYCNDDDPAELYEKVSPFLCGRAPFVTFLHYPYQGQQRNMYLHFLRNSFQESEWIAFLDVDEFLYLPRTKDINTYLERFSQQTDVIYFNWLMFGNSGYVKRPGGSVLDQYTRHEDNLHPYTKVIVRSSSIDLTVIVATSLHFWHDWPSNGSRIQRVNVLGESMDQYYESFPEKATAHVQRLGMLARVLREAVICHFVMKSEDDFDRRVRRGTGGEFAQQTSWGEHKQAGRYADILARFNAVEFTALQSHWRSLFAFDKIPSAVMVTPSVNLARGKPARQSSVSQWSLHPTVEADAMGAVSGIITGRHQFHTDEEEGAWWQVDLGQREKISEIRLYNRLDACQNRARYLTLSLSDGGVSWREVFRKADESLFGGIDGAPLRWIPNSPVEGRFVRVALVGRGFLHLDQVEVYGPSQIADPEPVS